MSELKKSLFLLLCILFACTVRADLLVDSSWRIVLPEKADATVKFAADELQWHLGQITGKKPEIVPYAPNITPAVYLQYVPKTDPEHWMIRTEGKNIFISGGYPRGVQYGVYELLERYGNCRWFTPKCSRIPRADGIKIPVPLKMEGEPWFKHRSCAWLITLKQASVEEWKRYLARIRYGMDHWLFRRSKDREYLYSNRIGSPGMTHTFYAYQKDWKDVKPEYYAMLENGKRAPRMNGAGSGAQFCMTNPDVRDRVFTQLLKFIESDRAKADKENLPYPIYYVLSPNDNTRFCLCPSCRKLDRGKNDNTNSYVDFINDIAGRLKKIHPELQIKCSGYTNTKNPPDRPLLDNVTGGLAFLDSEFLRDEDADVMRPLTHPVNRVPLRFLEGWRAKAPGGVEAHQYASHFTLQYRVPCDATRKLDVDLKLYKKFGARWVTMEMYERDNCFFWLRRYVLNKLTVDPDIPLDVLVKEFMDGYYGPAAAPMLKYYKLLADGTEKEPNKLSMTPLTRISYLTPEFFRKADALLDEAEKLAGNDRRILYAVQDERLPLDAVRVYNYDQMKVPLDRKALQDRYFSVKQRMGEEEGYYNFKTDIHHSFITCGGIACEKAVFQAPVPEQFRGRKIFSWFAVSEKRARDKVKDPEAAGGIAVKLGKEPYQSRLRMKLYDTREEKNLHDEFVLTSFPEDEKYHWYYIHTADLYGHIIFWTNLFQNNLSWAIVPPPQNRMEIYVSLKFTGPTFVPGSKKPNGIFLDRIIATPPRQK